MSERIVALIVAACVVITALLINKAANEDRLQGRCMERCAPLDTTAHGLTPNGDVVCTCAKYETRK